MLHMTRSVHVGMKWHAMTFALHLCTGHHVESGVSAWLGSTLCLVFDHGKSTLCLVFDVCHEDMVNRYWCSMYVVRTWLIDTVFCSMVSSVKWDNVQIKVHCCVA